MRGLSKQACWMGSWAHKGRGHSRLSAKPPSLMQAAMVPMLGAGWGGCLARRDKGGGARADLIRPLDARAYGL